MKYFTIMSESLGLILNDQDAPVLYPTASIAQSWILSPQEKVVSVSLRICTPSRRANSAAKKKVNNMATAKKVVKKPAGKASGKAAPYTAAKPKAKGKK
jgi:hypothetical protein